MSRIKITVKELINYLRNKKCDTPYPIYVANKILKNPNHIIASKDADEFSLREIFEHIEITDEPKDTSDM